MGPIAVVLFAWQGMLFIVKTFGKYIFFIIFLPITLPGYFFWKWLRVRFPEAWGKEVWQEDI